LLRASYLQGARQQELDDYIIKWSRRGLASCLFHLTTGRFVSCCQGFCGVSMSKDTSNACIRGAEECSLRSSNAGGVYSLFLSLF
jgi:hypothetical protein